MSTSTDSLVAGSPLQIQPLRYRRGHLSHNLKSMEMEEFRVTLSFEEEDFDFDADSLKLDVSLPPSPEKSTLNRISLDRSKAGLEQVDIAHVNRIIQETSKGGRFYTNEERKDESTTQKILELKRKMETLKDLRADERSVERMLEKFEGERDFSKTILHVDMDAFYCSVEELDEPNYKNVPMAVGGLSMLTTANYEARKFGCRAAQPGYIARKLCPQLVLVKPNFEKYVAASKSVRRVLERYDPNFAPMSLDEAYLDITPYMKVHAMSPDQVAESLRNDILRETGLTASAGIACNTRLAKICCDLNKPNGQYFLKSDIRIIKDFMTTLKVRKIPGVGKVLNRILKEVLDIETCGDVLDKRVLIYKLFSTKSVEFLLHASLGLGNTSVTSSKITDRKSISCERTFKDCSNIDELYEKLLELCHHLWDDCQEAGVHGAKNVGVKLKSADYRVMTRNHTVSIAITSVDSLVKHAKDLLKLVVKEQGSLNLRLMGIRCSNLIFQQSDGGDLVKWFKRAEEAKQPKQLAPDPVIETLQCPVCFETFQLENFQFNIHVDKCLKSKELAQLQGNKKDQRTVTSYFKKK